ncbi:MAG TPA: FtsX-like permease family protein, partial [Thermoanaerobaculia bacterium]
AAAVSLVVAALPALRAAAASPAAALALGGRSGSAPGPGERRATRALVAAEVALAAVALVGSGLFLRALSRAQGVDPGVRTRGLSYLSLDLAAAGYEGVRAQGLVREIVRSVREIPGVTGAGVSILPPIGGGPQRTVLREGTDDEPGRVAPAVTVNAVSPGYLAAAGVRLLRGRDVADQDREGTAPVAVVNETFAARHWPGQNAIGRRFRIFGGAEGIQVVGIASNTLVARLDEPPQPVAYLPLAQTPIEVVAVSASTDGDSAALLTEMGRRVQGIDRGLAPFDAFTVEAALARGLWAPRALATLLLLFGGLALALAAVGLYGLVAQSVSERVQEIGIRMALGATPGSVRGLVLREGAWLAGVGVPLGLAAAAILSRYLSGVLYGLETLDPATFLGVPALLAAATALACLVPAQRAIRLDPAGVLRG